MKQKNLGVNIGSSSILLIFVLLCLVSFATLSIVSAHADINLNKKIEERMTSYYEACNSAETSIAEIDHTLSDLYASGISEEEYFKQVGHTISYAIPISDTQSLNIELTIRYPKQSGETFYSISSWKVITPEVMELDDSLHVFIPEM